MRTLRFLWLYLYAAFKSLRRKQRRVPSGLKGQAVFMFFDPDHPARRHGVVAFVLPNRVGTEEFLPYLFGPFGYENEIDFHGLHLYGRDTWGTVNQRQINSNVPLMVLAEQYLDRTIVLAGVRPFWGRHLPPLNDPTKFVLVYR